MQDSKLIKLLKCLNPDAMRRLRKVLVSPFFTLNESLGHLYYYLKKYYPDFENARLKKEIIFAKLFPDHAYSDSKMRNLMSEFTILVEGFLIGEELKKKDCLRQKILLDIYQNKEEELYLKTLNKLTHQLNQSPFRNPEYFSEAFHLALQHTEWSAEHNQIEEAFFRQKETELLLHNYYKLLQAKFQLARNARQGLTKEIQKEKPNALFSNSSLETNPLYELYRMSESFLESGETKKINPLLKALKEAKGFVEAGARREVFVALLNFCIGQMQLKETDFLPLVFDLYQFGIAEEILLENQRISATTFLNIVIAGGRMNASEWTRNFLKEYASYLKEEEGKDVVVLGKAYLFFYTQKFLKSLQTLTQHNFQNPIQLYPARTYILRTYLELYFIDETYFDALHAQCAAFEKYIRRNDLLSAKRKKAALAFGKMILKIVNAGRNKRIDKSTKEVLKRDLEKTSPIESRKWLLEKLELFG